MSSNIELQYKKNDYSKVAPPIYAEDYRLTIVIGIHERSIIWNASKPFALDFPIHWTIQRSEAGFIVSYHPKNAKAEKKQYALPLSSSLNGEEINVHATEDTDAFTFRISLLERIRPAFSISSNDTSAPSRLFLFYGQRNSLVNYSMLGESYSARVQQSLVFSHKQTADGYLIKSNQDGVKYRVTGEKSHLLEMGETLILSQAQFSKLRIKWQSHWWRVNRIPLAPALPADAFSETDHKDTAAFNALCKKAGMFFAFVALILFVLPQSKLQKQSAPTLVNLKKPKLIVGKEEKPKQVAKKQLPLPKPIEIAKAKPAKKPAPPAAPKIAKTPKPPAPKIAKVQPPPAPKVAPVPVSKPVQVPIAKAPPAPVKIAAVPTRPAPPSAKVVKAMETARINSQLSKSLGFLSSNPKATSKTVAYTAPVDEKGTQGIGNITKLGKNAKYLAALTVTNGNENGSIETSGVRGVANAKIMDDSGGVNFGGSGKGFNKVLGKVALNSLYGEGGGDGEMGDALGGKGGLTMAGAGTLDEKLIMAALAKHLDRLQYCYEKALLTNASLSGNIMMEWGISTSGSVSGVKVVKSQMNDNKLHSCISKEIAKITFPGAKGGTVSIKYPFNFSSTSL